MTRLNLTVEGKTEQAFVIRLLVPHLADCGVYVAKPRLTALRRKKGTVHRGGVQRYQPLKNDLLDWIKQDAASEVYFTTMIDFYGLPSDFPRLAETRGDSDPYQRLAKMEEAFEEDIGDRRFIAYIQLHEFETLLFSQPEAFGRYFVAHEEPVESLVAVRDEFGNPELINEGEDSAPSKRIGKAIPKYLTMKSTMGPLVAAAIGIPTIRQNCAHFDQWLTKLENLAN
jgi:hypothetical protein